MSDRIASRAKAVIWDMDGVLIDCGPFCLPAVRSADAVQSALSARRMRRVRAACACNASGRPLAFFNADMGGGFTAVYRDTGAPYDSHICWIGNMRCYADEAHLGGIVVQVE